jgi:hypothetical protein
VEVNFKGKDTYRYRCNWTGLHRFLMNLISKSMNFRLDWFDLVLFSDKFQKWIRTKLISLVRFGSNVLISLQRFLFSMYFLSHIFSIITFSITHNTYVINYHHTSYIKENTMIFKHIFELKQSWQNTIHK